MENHFLNDDKILQNNNPDNVDELDTSSESIDVDDLLEDITSDEDISLDNLDDTLDLTTQNEPKEQNDSNIDESNESERSEENLEPIDAVPVPSTKKDQNQESAINSTYPNIPLLMNVNITLSVEIGRTKMQIGDVLNMGKGTIVELEKLHNEPVDIVINNNVIAQGQVVAVDEYLGVKILNILDPENRLKSE